MIAIDLAAKFDAPPGTIDYALVERIIHEALAAAHLPVVDVEIDQTRVVDGPFPQSPLAPDAPVDLRGAPTTRPPGAQY